MKGISLIEIIIIIAIVALITSFLTFALVDFRARALLTEAHSSVVSLLRDARARTIASLNNTVYGVHFQEDRAVLFTGTIYDSAASSNQIYFLPSTIIISTINFGGPQDIIFDVHLAILLRPAPFD